MLVRRAIPRQARVVGFGSLRSPGDSPLTSPHGLEMYAPVGRRHLCFREKESKRSSLVDSLQTLLTHDKFLPKKYILIWTTELTTSMMVLLCLKYRFDPLTSNVKAKYPTMHPTIISTTNMSSCFPRYDTLQRGLRILRNKCTFMKYFRGVRLKVVSFICNY